MKNENKWLILALLILISSNLLSQNNPDTSFRSIFPRNDENKIEYVKVIVFDSLSKKEIALRIKEWAISSFNSQKAALQSEDLESGYMLYQALKTTTYSIPKGWGFNFIGTKIYTITYETKFSINFYIKANKFKVVINNITDRSTIANGLWYEVFSNSIGDRVLDVPSIPIEDAGVASINEYLDHPNESKYIVRLNYSASIWRNIDEYIKDLIEGINSSITIKKKSPFNF